MHLQIYGQVAVEDPGDDIRAAKVMSHAEIPQASRFISLSYSNIKPALTDICSSLNPTYSLLDLDDVIIGGAEEESDEQIALRLHAEWNGTDTDAPDDR